MREDPELEKDGSQTIGIFRCAAGWLVSGVNTVTSEPDKAAKLKQSSTNELML